MVSRYIKTDCGFAVVRGVDMTSRVGPGSSACRGRWPLQINGGACEIGSRVSEGDSFDARRSNSMIRDGGVGRCCDVVGRRLGILRVMNHHTPERRAEACLGSRPFKVRGNTQRVHAIGDEYKHGVSTVWVTWSRWMDGSWPPRPQRRQGIISQKN